MDPISVRKEHVEREGLQSTTTHWWNQAHPRRFMRQSNTPELLDFLARQGIPFDVFRTARRPMSEAHNRQETPLFAMSIERHAMTRNSEAVAS